MQEESDDVVRTERLGISRLSFADTDFILKLLNEPPFIRFIGDRNVRSEQDAKRYLVDGPLASYEKNGFGLFRVSSKDSQNVLGICGLVKRDALALPDLGFAFLQSQWGNGYALESCRAVLQYAVSGLGLSCVIAIVNTDNAASIRLLNKLGFKFEKMVRMPGETEDICQYTIALQEIYS